MLLVVSLSQCEIIAKMNTLSTEDRLKNTSKSFVDSESFLGFGFFLIKLFVIVEREWDSVKVF